MQKSDIDSIASAVAALLSDGIVSAQTQRLTFKDFAGLYLEKYAKLHKQSWLEDEERLGRYLLPIFGDKFVDEITHQEVVMWHSSLSRIPYTANRSLEQLGVMLKLAKAWSYYPEGKKLATLGVRPYKEQARDRFLSPDELQRLAVCINRLKARHLRALLWLYLLTGLRKTELLSVRWSQLDFKRRELTILKTKNGRKLCLPLSSSALSLFQELPMRSEFVFPGARPGTHLTRFEGCWNRVRNEAELSDVRIHDLRRTVGSWLAQAGDPLRLVADVLNHQDVRTTEIYARFSNTHVREALQRHAQAISPFIEGEYHARSDRKEDAVRGTVGTAGMPARSLVGNEDN